jgi:hypothetical protein
MTRLRWGWVNVAQQIDIEFFKRKGGFYANAFGGPALSDCGRSIMEPDIDVSGATVTTSKVADDRRFPFL